MDCLQSKFSGHPEDGIRPWLGALDILLTFSLPAAYSCVATGARDRRGSHPRNCQLAVSLRGVRIRHRPSRALPRRARSHGCSAGIRPARLPDPQQGAVVSKDDLINTIWNGRVVSDAALTTRLNVARSVIGDSGEKQRLIKTLQRKGFRFVGTVQEVQKPADAALTADSGEQSSQGIAGLDRSDAATATMSIPAPRLSIVVLPFAKFGGDSEQD